MANCAKCSGPLRKRAGPADPSHAIRHDSAYPVWLTGPHTYEDVCTATSGMRMGAP